MNLTVLSVGGSIIAPDKVDSTFLKAFREAIVEYLEEDKDAKLILVCGGGAPARVYQEAYRAVRGDGDTESQDWLGIKATHLNGEVMRAIFSDYTSDSVVTDPTDEKISFKGRILVAAGWKPGFSTDTDAVFLARRFGGKKVVNLSNIKKVYTDDPRKNPDAVPLDSISWKDAALIEPLTIGEHCTARARVCEDDVVFILGTGTIGTIIAQACKLRGVASTSVGTFPMPNATVEDDAKILELLRREGVQ